MLRGRSYVVARALASPAVVDRVTCERCHHRNVHSQYASMAATVPQYLPQSKSQKRRGRNIARSVALSVTGADTPKLPANITHASNVMTSHIWSKRRATVSTSRSSEMLLQALGDVRTPPRRKAFATPQTEIILWDIQPKVAYSHPCVTVLFSDIVGFTTLSTILTPEELMAMLHDLFCKFDTVCDNYNLYKVETIGDGYVAAAGLKSKRPPAAEAVAALRVARAFHAIASIVQVPSSADDTAWKSKSLKVRTGLHSGSLTSGIVGRNRPRYSLFGETVNTAARMESTAAAAQVQVSAATYHLLCKSIDAEVTKPFRPSKVHAKGLGEVTTYIMDVPYEQAAESVRKKLVERMNTKLKMHDTL